MKSAEGCLKRGLVALFVCSFLLPALASAGGRSSTKYQYAVKFICGNITEDTGQVVPGDYATAINIQNASGRTAAVSHSLSLTFPTPGPLEPGAVIPIGVVPADGLGSLEAFEVDCGVREILDIEDPFVKGVWLIESNRRLNVIAVYTQGDVGGTDPTSIDVETIEARVIEVKRRKGHDRHDRRHDDDDDD